VKTFLNFVTRLFLLVATCIAAIPEFLGLPSMPLTFGVTCDSLDTLNNFFATAKNQFTLPIYNWIWRTNPWVGIIPRSMFDYMDGLTPEVNTSTAELPTSYPDNLANVTLSDGTGNGACVTAPRTILDGYINRSYQLEFDSWKTRTFCLTDLQFSWQAETMATNLQKNMQQYTTVRWSDWYRIKNISMIDTKVSTGSGSNYDSATNSDANFSAVDLPTAELDWDHLNCFYDAQIALGAEPVGYSEGQQLYALTVGPGYKRKLWQTNTLVRDTVNWGDAFQNFTARGINTSINGFIPNVDEFPIRYAANGTTKIYPTINTGATVGRKFIPNPDYKTVAKGGLAVYETFNIMPLNIYEVKVRPTGPTNFGGLAFDPVNYVGDPQWINNKDMCENILGNMGFYLMNLAMAAKPIRPEVGFTGLTLAKDC
jgi:hypothetical protein